MIEVFATILVVIAVILVVVAVIVMVVASIGEVMAVFAKNKGPEFDIFFQKFKNGISFLLLADFFTCTIIYLSNFTYTLFFCR